MEDHMHPSVMKLFSLEGRVAIITGAARGLGAGMAKGLGGAGAKVVVADCCAEKDAAKGMAELAAMGVTATFVQTDVADAASVEAMTKRALSLYGTVDILVNNAGVGLVAAADTMPEELWDKTIAVNLKGVRLCCQSVGRHMMSRRYGRIVNIASYWASTGNPGGLAYSAAKSGVMGMTRVLAVEWGPYNIAVNAVAPGYINTEMNKWITTNPRIQSYITDRIPLGHRLGEIDELMGVAIFLSSEACSHITGALIPVDGGIIIQGSQADWFT
jgi:NAD(P)-dependent dehydrogenase (short-subunit alcohol dehydrogenase family)